MGFIDFVEEIEDKIRVFFFYLGVHLSPPIMLLGLVYTMGIVLWRIFVSVGESVPTIYPTIFTIVVSFLFLVYVIYLSFPPAKRVKIIVDAYGNNPRIIPFIAKKVEGWLEDIVKFMEKEPNMEEISEAIAVLNTNRLKELQEKFLKPRRLVDRIEKKGNYLNALIGGVSESFQIPLESIEELINTKVEVNRKINKEIFISYDQIKAYMESLANIEPHAPAKVIAYFKRKINERIDYLEAKEKRLNTQIKWLKVLGKRKKVTPALLEIIKEPSTGKAVSKLSRLLSENAKTSENSKTSEKEETIKDLIWLIQFANSRKGVKLGELFGLKIMKGIGNETLNWYGTPVSVEEGNLQAVEIFLNSFVMKRSEALEKLWEEFRKWNERTNKLNFAQPIAIGLISGYSSALRRILEGICKDVMYLFSIDAVLVEKVSKKCAISEELKNKFGTEGFTLSENATISKEKADKWEINNGRKIYIGKKEDGKLNFYDVENIRLLRIILIKCSEAHGDEEILKAELMADYPGLKCDIMPIEVIERREIQRQIGNIFVGIEGINKQGDIIHPRGGSEVIRKIRKYKKDTEVYAFGESYKVLDFTEDDLDYTKLLLFRHENIDYVVTDHGVHERKGKKWEIEEKSKDDLDCCARSWRENYIG